uniref:Uncharacterized protein n=1 Tax=uncultured marine virus TaxID=186617 RepID=A0A0F7L8P1_9VIRU|nr:hypothetical protein [uncultured marine virus]
MILATTIQSERGKPVTKTANEYINITFTKERRQKFDISFKGDSIEIMRYFDGTTHIINYAPCDICKDITCKNHDCIPL